MDIGEKLFELIAKKRKSKIDQHAVYLKDIKEKIEIYVRAITRFPIQVISVDDIGGSYRHLFLLPQKINLCKNSKDNLNIYIYRSFYYSFLFLKRYQSETRNFNQWQLDEWPGLIDIAKDLSVYPEEIVCGTDVELNFAEISGESLKDIDLKDDYFAKGKEYEGKTKTKVDEINIEEKKEEGGHPVTHSFEKLETAEEYSGGFKTLDGDDQMNDHMDALDEVEFSKVTKTQQETKSIFRSDIILKDNREMDLSFAHEHEMKQFKYPEWDFKKGIYHKDHCTIFEQTSFSGVIHDLEVDTEKVQYVKKVFDELFNQYAYVKRQRRGSDIDIDACVDYFTTLSSGHSPDEAIYIDQKQKIKDTAIFVLVDASLSTDSYLDNKKILEIEKESLVVLTESLGTYPIPFEIAFFYSLTRNKCLYQLVKAYDQNINQTNEVKDKIQMIRPTGYTRIGPAIRHAISRMIEVKAKKKVLLLITDGKPTDFDKYEGIYGIEDIKKASKEVRSQNITLKVFAIEKEAKNYLPMMFAKNEYHIIPGPERITTELVSVIKQILRG